MSLLAGALCTDGTWAADRAAFRMAERSCRYPHLSLTPLRVDQRFALVAIGRQQAVVPTIEAADGQLGWVLGDVNEFAERPQILAEDLLRPLVSLDEKLMGRWVLISYETSGHRLRVTTDRLGLLWLYVARIPGGVLFATDFGALAEEVGGRLSVNRDAVLWELTCGYSLGDATVFNEIELLPGATTVELGAEGVRVIERNPIRFGDRHAGLTRKQKFELLDAIYDETLRELVRCAGSNLTLSISAGNDSRYMLALLHKAGVVPRLCTFGHPESEEVAGATAVCARIGLKNEVFPIPPSRWEAWERTISMLGNSGILQWSGWVEEWLSFLRSKGDNVIVGNFGDALSGSYLRSMKSYPADWAEYFLRWNNASGWLHSPLLRPEARTQTMDSIADHVTAEFANAEFAFPFQRAMYLNLVGRQRRWVGAQPNLLARGVMPIVPFFRKRLMEFWANLPLEDVVDQNLYLEYARSRYPRLFPAPRHPAALLTERVLRKLTRMGNALIGNSSREAPRPVVIDRNKAIMPNKAAIVGLARSVAHAIDGLIDVDGFCETVERFDSTDQLGGGHIIRAVNVFFLLSLATPAASTGRELAKSASQA